MRVVGLTNQEQVQEPVPDETEGKMEEQVQEPVKRNKKPKAE